MKPAGRLLRASQERRLYPWHRICSLAFMYPCATVAMVNSSSCDVACPPPETHHLREES
jgi:hypothetical protein